LSRHPKIWHYPRTRPEVQFGSRAATPVITPGVERFKIILMDEVFFLGEQ
jgi:hypothetical protein